MKLKYLFILALIASVTLNILFIAVELQQRNTIRSYYEMLCVDSPTQTDIKSFHKYVVDGSTKILKEGIDIPQPQQLSWFKDHLITFFSKKDPGFNKNAFHFGENSFLLNALIQEAQLSNNDSLLHFVCKIFDENVLILPPLNSEKTIDRAPYGTTAILLYKITKNEKYKNYADEEYKWLCTRDSTDVGIIYYKRDKQAVEAIGYTCPFLMQYSEVFNEPSAKEMAINQINKYCEHGMEERSGLPAVVWRRYPPYNSTSTHNWGRGNAWFSIGVLAVDSTLLSKHSADILKRYCKTLTEIYKRHGCFHQFLDDARTEIDMCAELPLIYFLYKKGLLKIRKQDLLKYSRYMKEGIIYHSSGIISHPGSPCRIVGSSNRLSQAYLLKLINEIQ